jgi:hypothetical protein
MRLATATLLTEPSFTTAIPRPTSAKMRKRRKLWRPQKRLKRMNRKMRG